MNNFIKAHIIAFVLSQFSTREMREVIAELNLQQEKVFEFKDVQFRKVGRFKDRIIIDLGAMECEIAESDFFKLISEIEKEESIADYLPAQER
jgi:hypothetical protein